MKLATSWVPRITVDLTPADCALMAEAAHALVDARYDRCISHKCKVGRAYSMYLSALHEAIDFEMQVNTALGGIRHEIVKEGE